MKTTGEKKLKEARTTQERMNGFTWSTAQPLRNSAK
jgi:hypothetical protein